MPPKTAGQEAAAPPPKPSAFARAYVARFSGGTYVARFSRLAADAAFQAGARLLEQHLTPAEQESLINNGYIELSKPTWQIVYRIDAFGNVGAHDRGGQRLHGYCIGPRDDSLPAPDLILAHKWLLLAYHNVWIRTARRAA